MIPSTVQAAKSDRAVGISALVTHGFVLVFVGSTVFRRNPRNRTSAAAADHVIIPSTAVDCEKRRAVGISVLRVQESVSGL